MNPQLPVLKPRQNAVAYASADRRGGISHRLTQIFLCLFCEILWLETLQNQRGSAGYSSGYFSLSLRKCRLDIPRSHAFGLLSLSIVKTCPNPLSEAFPPVKHTLEGGGSLSGSEERFILTVVGKDHPGIIAGIAGTLYKYECNIQELNQTVLSDEFAMILLLQPTKKIEIQELDESLKVSCKALEVTYTLRATRVSPDFSAQPSTDKVIITVIGADRIGIVANVTKVLADRNINIVALSTAPSYMIHDIPQYTMIARVEVDDDADMPELRNALEDCARSLSVEINIQNQEIFNAMHKV